LIAHFSVIGVSSFEFAAADDETQDNFATPCAPSLKKPSQILPHCHMPCTCHCSHCAIIFISNNNFIVHPHHHHRHLKYIIIMPYVKKAGQGALGEDLAIKGKAKAITSFFQVKPKPPKPLPKRKQGRPRKTPPPQLSPSKRAKSQQSINNGTAALASIPQRKPSRTYMNYKDPEMAATMKEAVNAYVSTGKLMKLADLEVSHLPPTVIPSATIRYHAKKLSENNRSTRSSNDAGGGSLVGLIPR
jgi:hypothetical protein